MSSLKLETFGSEFSASVEPSDGQIYDFCMDWSMNMSSKRILCKKFFDEKWDWTYFSETAQARQWFARSMYALLYAEDFGGK